MKVTTEARAASSPIVVRSVISVIDRRAGIACAMIARVTTDPVTTARVASVHSATSRVVASLPANLSVTSPQARPSAASPPASGWKVVRWKAGGGKPGGGKSFGGKPGGRPAGGPRSGGPAGKPSGGRSGAPKGKR